MLQRIQEGTIQVPSLHPPHEAEKKRWEDALHSLAAYASEIGKPLNRPPITVGLSGTILGWQHVGVFTTDPMDGLQAWYWKVNPEDTGQVCDSPAEACIDFLFALENQVGADHDAPTLVFSVRLPAVTCLGDDHLWRSLGEVREGWHKGEQWFECQICKIDKWE